MARSEERPTRIPTTTTLLGNHGEAKLSRMKISSNDALIERGKLTRYLLVPKPKNDKSHFLVQAGFTAANPDALEGAIRRLIGEEEAVPIARTSGEPSIKWWGSCMGHMVHYEL